MLVWSVLPFVFIWIEHLLYRYKCKKNLLWLSWTNIQIIDWADQSLLSTHHQPRASPWIRWHQPDPLWWPPSRWVMMKSVWSPVFGLPPWSPCLPVRLLPARCSSPGTPPGFSAPAPSWWSPGGGHRTRPPRSWSTRTRQSPARAPSPPSTGLRSTEEKRRWQRCLLNAREVGCTFSCGKTTLERLHLNPQWRWLFLWCSQQEKVGP